LELRDIPFEKEKLLSIAYKGLSVSGFRADIIVSGQIIVELKAVAAIEPIFRAQLFSYLKASGIRLGILINFNVLHLANGIYRIINGF
jgi:GxxExxY protein